AGGGGVGHDAQAQGAPVAAGGADLVRRLPVHLHDRLGRADHELDLMVSDGAAGEGIGVETVAGNAPVDASFRRIIGARGSAVGEFADLDGAEVGGVVGVLQNDRTAP